MKKYYKYLIILLIPFLLGFVISRYGPWWGFREQASTPDTPSNGVKIFADSSNDLYSLHEDGDTYKLNVLDPNGNLTTTGYVDAGIFYVADYIYHKDDVNTVISFDPDRFRMYAGSRVMIDAVEATQDYIYLGYEEANDIDVSIGPNAAIAVAGDTGIVTLQNYLRTATSKWYYCQYVHPFSLSPGGSGATATLPDPNTNGGYLLDNAAEYLYFSGKACTNWDGASDLDVIITYEVNIDNTGGNAGDTVDLSLLTYFKGDTDTANKTQTIEVANTVGASAMFKQFTSTHSIDYDDPNNTVDSGDIFSFRINLETDTSEVDSVVINFITFRYQTAKVHVEI